ncbi:DNA primase [Camelliibacillus cellulosilyticus]|uniref:DNA primase n=1 Tax=Camelliibacillus cellulosilyticus TaxID=2174486 RepID=A0ABV9GL71_9BACL
MKVDNDTIEKIRTSLDIVEIAGEYVQLRKQGRSYLGLCPFHNEKTPSFSISPEKQIFHCFGCGVGGNIYNFIMEIEGLSFPEAIQFLAQKAGIAVPQLDRREHRDREDFEPLYHGMELLTKLYHYLLVTDRYGQAAIKYLNERGFTREIIDKFQIGFAVDAWETASRFLEKRHFDLAPFEKIGMLSKRSFDGKFFDRFRGRIMFPIRDHKGKTVAFAGRVLTDEKPKYLNSPESNIFHKGRILYGYDLARAAIKKKNEAILLEGYVDVIKAHQAGISNAVASMGTALTDEQARLLTRNAEKIIICYDSDQAGIDATLRAAEMVKGQGKTVKIAKMPAGLDPDDYISRYGGDRFLSDVIGASQTIMAFKIQYLRNGKNLNDEGDRLRYIEEVLYEVSTLTQAVERDHYLRQLAEEFSISLDALKQEQFQIYRKMRRSETFERKERLTLESHRKLHPAYEAAERTLLAHMMRDAAIAEDVRDRAGASFNIDIHQALAAHLYAFYSEGREADIASFLQRLDEELRAAATEIAMMQVNDNVSPKEIEDCIRQMIRHGKEIEIERKEREKREAERNRDLETAAKILAEMISMKKELQRN